MMWDHDWNGASTWAWLVMVIAMIAFWTAVVWVLVVLLRNGPQTRAPDPEEILAARFARGEIDAEEFEQRRATLEHRSTSPS